MIKPILSGGYHITNVVAVIWKGTAFFSRYAYGLYDTCPEPRGWWDVSLLCLGRAPTTCQSHQSDESRVFMIQPKARVCTDWISKIDTDNYSLRWWEFFFLIWRTVTQWLPKGGDPITWSSKSENYHLKPKSAFCEMLYNVGAKFWNGINRDGLK